MAACLWVCIIDDNTVIVDLQLWVLVPVPAQECCDMANDFEQKSSHAYVVPHLISVALDATLGTNQPRKGLQGRSASMHAGTQ